ncbi:hypothetical protein E8E11_004171 [Didymella keratinophila]|nr:hypothetical protein E8E11_004171 [Didymella keratinophila]
MTGLTGQHLCDERIANLWQIIQQLCQQEHTRRQSGQELSVNIPRAIHAIQEEIGTLQEINQTVASWQKGKSLTCAKDLLANHTPVWNTVLLLNFHNVKREGLIIQQSDLAYLKAFAKCKNGDASVSQREDILTSEIVSTILKSLALDTASVASKKLSFGPAVIELQELLDQSERLVDVGSWIDALHHVGGLLPLLVKLKIMIELEKARTNDSALACDFETKVEGHIVGLFAEQELVETWKALHLMSTRYSEHPMWVGLNKQFDFEVKTSDIATVREFAGLPLQ